MHVTRAGLRHRPTRPWPRAPRFKGPRAKQSKKKNLPVCSLIFNARMGAMHFSAKRGIGIACRLSVRQSVCPSVTLVDQDHTGWKSWKLIARSLSPIPSLFGAQMGTWGNFGETRGGVKKMAFWSTKTAISLKRAKIQKKLPWKVYRLSLIHIWRCRRRG